MLLIAAAAGALLFSVSGRYDYVTDELYFLAAGKYYLDWGYMDQQPLVPVLARGLDALFPGSLPALRLPAALMVVFGGVFTALIARELGGDRRAQVLAAAAYPLSPWLLLSGHWLMAATLEPLQWTVIFWLLARWVRIRQQTGVFRDRLLLVAALVTALALQTKFQVVVLVVAILVAAAAVGPRALPTRPLLWVGALGVLLTAAPTLLWQARNGWPALEMGTVVSDESNRWLLLPTGLFYAGVLVGLVLCCAGAVSLLRNPQLRQFRFLGWSAVLVVVFYLLSNGRPNYLASLFGLLYAAGAVGLQLRRQRSPRPRWQWLPWPAYLLSAVVPVALLPIYPLSFLAQHPNFPSFPRLYETGWPQLRDAVVEAYQQLPPETRSKTVVVASRYDLAGPLDVYGRPAGLPRVYSPHRGYWFFGSPPESAVNVLHVGEPGPLAECFRSAEQLGTVESELVNIPQGVPVTLYRDREQSWQVLWPRLRTM